MPPARAGAPLLLETAAPLLGFPPRAVFVVAVLACQVPLDLLLLLLLLDRPEGGAHLVRHDPFEVEKSLLLGPFEGIVIQRPARTEWSWLGRRLPLGGAEPNCM